MNIPISIEQKKAIAQLLADIIFKEMMKDMESEIPKTSGDGKYIE